MHYLAFVIVPRQVAECDVPIFVALMLEPYNVNLPIVVGVYPMNPRAEWDYWNVGGRWDGLISGHSNVYGEGLVAKWARNTVKVSELPKDILPDVIVTPDGCWHDFWNDTKNHEPDEWDSKARLIISQHSDSLAVVIDYHGW